ncbi:FAD-dependent monooxygenase [Streptomyces angustmyceticus]|uniref:2-polyprenyl-6-methoxyphenol hydroxylase n=1 Tax=Streptomyces angustmyceticus TaxID=285578 RepID=A0A5J4L3J8_9ACTN|nr:FAD-dependent monooxygenase [Streptomyces angustmyceticus]UAL66251.1 FAD-dependent monooxygenase [Streptomyces angustmyceticus]GES28987.1 2-polyprenyl-6-methoxyphenol hydroxylase [Streptomyces angustmyceticus]
MSRDRIRIAGADVAVVGGSIAGCATALAAHRGGAGRVTVFERTAGHLADRGVGLAVHNARYAELASAGYLDTGMPWVQLTTRRWYVRDGAAPLGREIGTLPFPFRSYCWGPLWRELRRRLPEETVFRPGVRVDAVAETADGATLRLDGADDGGESAAGHGERYGPGSGSGRRSEHFDLVIGADGYRSVVREAAFPGVRPDYAGYLAWRGAVPAERLTELRFPGLPAGPWAEEDCVYGVFDGGHVIIYRIPDGAGGHRANWVLYTAPPAGLDLGLDTPTSLPPGTLTDALHAHFAYVTDELLPPYWGGLMRLTPRHELFIQPMYDFTAARYTAGRLLLAGDAATVARPHTGAGAVKALQDAAALEAALRATPERPDAAAGYGAERGAAGRTMVELGRRLGRFLVQDTPDWRTLDQAGLTAAWAAADGSGSFGGRELKS